MQRLKKTVQLLQGESRGCAAAEIERADRIPRKRGAVTSRHGRDLVHKRIHKFRNEPVPRHKIKVAIGTGLLAERDMDVNAAHRYRELFRLGLDIDWGSFIGWSCCSSPDC